MSPRVKAFSTLLLLCLYPGTAAAQLEPEGAEAAARPHMRAFASEAAPVLDGDVVGDPAWRRAVPVRTFWQTTPYEGEAASEAAEVRVLYTADTLYVGAVLYDREPGRIIISDSRRDASLEETDSFSFILDTYRDGQNGFVFGTNPAGIEYDAQVTNEGQGGGAFGGPRQQGGSGGGFNLNWDGSWEVHTQVSDLGWSAEFAIPFRTLRFTAGEDLAWGINFMRTIRRRNEKAYWAPLPRQYELYRVSMAGTLEGLSLQRPRNLQLTPYVLARSSRDFTVPGGHARPRGDFGADAKYSITPSLTLDATYNTDFAQVEVDEEQVNLDRFNLFFPEKRPFFLENAGLFAAGVPGEIELFFSRRIGIGPGGVAVPILAGARLSGEVGGTKVGLLDMQTEAVGGLTQAHNFAVARVKRELPNRSALGVLFTNRQGTGSLAPEDDYNRLLAVDGQLGIRRYGLVSGFATRSFTPALEGDEYAYSLQADYDSEAWQLAASYTEVGAHFNPEVGFLRRHAYRKPTAMIFHRYRPKDFLGFLELRPHARYEGYWGFDGFHETGFLHVDNHWEWKNGYEIHTGVNFTREGVREPFEISDGVVVPPGTYDHRELQLVGNTDQGKWISLSMRSFLGGFFGGDRFTLSPVLRLRAGEALNTQFSISRNRIDLPGGRFTVSLLQTRVSYSFTPRIYLQGLVQYNTGADLWSANLRFGWLQRAGTGLFIVFNQANDLYDADGLPTRYVTGIPRSRSIIVKYSRLFNMMN